MKIYIYVFIPSKTGSEEGDKALTYALSSQLGYMCCK